LRRLYQRKHMGRFAQFKESLRHAYRGLAYALKNEKNFQNEVIFALMVIFSMFYFGVTRAEMVVLILVIMGVLLAELVNTVMERVVDILKPRIHPYARLIKDLMAAAVLLTSILALIIGIIIFYPYIAKACLAVWGCY
jgi:undecaprenol kinase